MMFYIQLITHPICQRCRSLVLYVVDTNKTPRSTYRADTARPQMPEKFIGHPVIIRKTWQKISLDYIKKTPFVDYETDYGFWLLHKVKFTAPFSFFSRLCTTKSFTFSYIWTDFRPKNVSNICRSLFNNQYYPSINHLKTRHSYSYLLFTFTLCLFKFGLFSAQCDKFDTTSYFLFN